MKNLHLRLTSAQTDDLELARQHVGGKTDADAILALIGLAARAAAEASAPPAEKPKRRPKSSGSTPQP